MPWWAANTDATKRYHRMAGWYNSPECDALRAAWGAYPASPETLEAWPGFVQVTNAYLDHAGPPTTAPETIQVEEEGPPVSEEPYEPPLMMEEEREAPALSEEAAAEETGVAEEGAEILTNESLRDWVKRWCDGDREGLPPISTWNTSKVTDVRWLFKGQTKFNDDISAWNTSSVRTMSWMFRGASSFNQPLNDWRVDNVTDMNHMFCGASSFNQPLGDWRLRAGCNTHEMFNERFRNSRPVKASCCTVS